MNTDERILAMDRAATMLAQGMRLRERSRRMAKVASAKIAAANKILADLENNKPVLKVVK